MVVTIGVYLIINLLNTTATLWQRQNEVTQAQEELEKLKKESKDLSSQLEYSQTQEFLEKEARDKLGLVMEGERQVLIEEEALTATESGIKGKNSWFENLKSWWNLFVY